MLATGLRYLLATSHTNPSEIEQSNQPRRWRFGVSGLGVSGSSGVGSNLGYESASTAFHRRGAVCRGQPKPPLVASGAIGSAGRHHRCRGN